MSGADNTLSMYGSDGNLKIFMDDDLYGLGYAGAWFKNTSGAVVSVEKNDNNLAQVTNSYISLTTESGSAGIRVSKLNGGDGYKANIAENKSGKLFLGQYDENDVFSVDQTGKIVAGSMTLVNTVNEFSTDGTFTDLSDSAVPTEKAIKTYIDSRMTHAHPYNYIYALQTNRVCVSNEYGYLAYSDITTTELGYLDNVTSNIQTQLNGKASTSHNHDASYSPLGHSHDYAPSSAGVSNGNFHDHNGGDGAQIAYSSLSGIPGSFAPSTHSIIGGAHSGFSGSDAGKLLQVTAGGELTFSYSVPGHSHTHTVTLTTTSKSVVTNVDFAAFEQTKETITYVTGVSVSHS